MSKPTDLVQGTLDMLILKILALQPLNVRESRAASGFLRFWPAIFRRAVQHPSTPPRPFVQNRHVRRFRMIAPHLAVAVR